MASTRSPARGTLQTRTPHRPSFSIDGGGTRLPRSPTVLLLVDFINPLAFSGADKIAGPALAAARATKRLKERLAREGVPAIYANDNYGVWRSDFHDILGYCAAQPGATGQMAQWLAPAEDDLVLLKPRHSAFFATPLDLVLSQMHAHTLVLVGLAADICVQISAMDATLRGYKLWVPADCTAAESDSAKKAALAYMARVLKADVRRSSSRKTLDA
jgi:nicotinamidase-related amidase